MSNKFFANFLFKNLVIICLAVVGLIGLCVIIGWHSHNLVLIQVIPGAISMQYNTALCFILLAASAGAMLSKRVPPLFPALGGALVGLFGLLVVFQYATGISLGIDTLFFYPWEHTLSAEPGRMALTSAVCFAVAGNTLCLLILRPRTLFVFVLAHTFPLSLGITSLLGYIFGITYVLPFRLGSQMAVHTAIAFTIYGAAMLFYAWQKIPQTQGGLPEWGPLIATVMAPVFFIGLTSSFQDSSLTARIGQTLLAISAIGMLVLAMYKIMHARIVYKGLILITIPLLFVLGFVLLVNQQKRAGEQAEVLELKTKEVIMNLHTLFEDLVDIQSSVRGYVITEDPSYLDPYKQAVREIPGEIELLKTQISDDPQQLARLENLAVIAAERMAVAEELKNLVDNGKQAEAIAYVKSGIGKRVMDEFREGMNVLLAEEERKDKIRRQEIQNSWQQFDRLLVGGVAANLFLALALVFLFTRGIGYRLQTLTENAKALAEGKKLATPITGNDEIAILDRTFHQMAQALQEAHDELESKVEERTRELWQATEEIKKLNESLEQRVIERTEQLKAANKELEAFSYSVSHDLRAPLRAIDGFSRIFIEDYADKLDDEGRRILDVIRKNAQNMGQLIDDLLAFSRLGRKQIETSIIDMSELAQDACTQIQLCPKTQIKIGQLPAATGDRTLIRQVFINLLSNAVKYSGTKEKALVEVGGQSENGENIYYVRDHGVGFDMKYADKLFGVFQRLHSIEEFEGTGVGLAIVQRIIHRHGGRVWAEAEVGKGATFYFALPQNDLKSKDLNNEHE
jgi:signal transduction histidine kinase